jgi:hypothetical protein
MTKLLALVALVALVGTTSAGIDIYLTKGADWQYINSADRFNPNEKTFAFTSGSPNPVTLSHGPFTQVAGTSETYYVWADFSNMPDSGNGSFQMWGCDLGSSYATGNATAAGYWYRHVQSAAYRRWGVNPDPMPFPGQAYIYGGTGVIAPDSGDLQLNAGGVSHALLAAFQFTSGVTPGNGTFYLGVRNPVGFVAVREFDGDGNLIHDWDTGPGGYYPNVSVMGQPYTHPNSQPLLAITTVPEPVGLVLFGFAGLLLRRR